MSLSPQVFPAFMIGLCLGILILMTWACIATRPQRLAARKLAEAKKHPHYKGQCHVCHEPVIHAYPWWTNKPAFGGEPLHEDCAAKYFRSGD